MKDTNYTHHEQNEIELIDFLKVVWKRRWLIIIPTFVLIVLSGVYSFLKTPVWQIDSLLLPAKFTIQKQGGEFEEVLVTQPKQISGRINEQSYNTLIAAELNLDIRELPDTKADTLRDTNLIRIITKDTDINNAKSIHLSLFNHLKSEMDKKVDVEMKNIDTQIEEHKISIQIKNILIKDDLNNIKLQQIQKNIINGKIVSSQNKLIISQERIDSITEEMKNVMERLKEIETQQRKTLAEKQQEGNTISLLLYSNEIQQNLQYYGTLDEKFSIEKINQENLNLLINEKREELKQVDTEIENLKNKINKTENEIKRIQNEIKLLNDRKTRIEYTQIIKDPTPSLYPVAPKKLLNIVIAGVLGLFIFTILALFLEYLQKQKAQFNKTKTL
ncbi:MAG: hypothetical protein JXL67_14070 [Calditrichaeota bacterium]|nr:hypothetical protein [Calditrichota bacterium]